MKYIDKVVQARLEEFREPFENYLSTTEREGKEDIEDEVSTLSQKYYNPPVPTHENVIRLIQESPEAFQKGYYTMDEPVSAMDALYFWCIDQVWAAFEEHLFKPHGLDIARPWEEE